METLKELKLDKGEFMEEKLRAYFLDLGYYAIRGAKIKFNDVEVTDVDLWLYHRTTPISRERINVDIKNKRIPNAVERIIVAKGIKEILRLDKCIVATTDKRNSVIDFGNERDVIVLNGNFLNRINRLKNDRFFEEDFNTLLRDEFSKFTINWFAKNEKTKTAVIESQDYFVANEVLIDIKDILTQIYAVPLKKENSTRLLYLYISYLCITIDYILKDYAFIEIADKHLSLKEGFRYGVTGQYKIKIRLEQLAKELSKSVAAIKSILDALPISILVDFFGNGQNAKNIFKWAIEYEGFAYKKEFIAPVDLPIELKGMIGMLCDFSQIDRKLIFG